MLLHTRKHIDVDAALISQKACVIGDLFNGTLDSQKVSLIILNCNLGWMLRLFSLTLLICSDQSFRKHLIVEIHLIEMEVHDPTGHLLRDNSNDHVDCN